MRFATLTAALLALSCTAFGQVKLICRLNTGVTGQSVATRYHINFLEQAPQAPFFLFWIPASVNAATIRAQMATDPAVLWTEDDAEMEMPERSSGGKGGTTAVVNDRLAAYGENSQALAQVGFSRAFASAAGRTVRVAVLDTGIAPNCTQIWQKTVAQYNAVEYQPWAYDITRGTDSNGNNVFDEGVGHGTAVAGVIEQMSPRSSFVIVRVADSDGQSSAWRIIKGLSFAAARQAEVANLSMGSTASIPALQDVMEWARTKGVLVVAAAGNNGIETLLSPASLSKAIAVTGVDATDHKAAFANFGGKVESCAPSTGILSYGTDGFLVPWSGTSLAAPFVSGAIIECLRHLPSKRTPDSVYTAFKGSGTDIDALNPNFKKKLGLRLWVPDVWAKIH